MTTVIRVNRDRLEQRLEAIAAFGATENGGVTRLTLSDEDRDARHQLIAWFEDAGCEIHIDAIGNVFAVYPGRDRSLPPVMTGSHGDSQPRGGKFDGILGIIAGLEVVYSLREHTIQLERDFVVVNWTNEEGTRFTPGCTGSGVWAKKLDLEKMYELEDHSGTRLENELERIGFKGSSSYTGQPVHAAFELHIEQGPVLDKRKIPIGIPEGIVCLRWYDIEVTGEANHAGTTPMNDRSDAVHAFSLMSSRIHDIALETGHIVATVGEVRVSPNSRNVVPGSVYFTIDVRGWDEPLTDAACVEIEAALAEIAGETACRMSILKTWKESRAVFNTNLVELIRESADRLELDSLDMVSGASHDMIFINQVAPAAMIFVPSIGGKSHSEKEETSYADCAAGADVLLDCVIRTGNELEKSY